MAIAVPTRARGRRAVRSSTTSAGATVTARTFAILGGAIVWLIVYLLVLSGLQEQRAQHDLYGSLREQLAAETVPIGGAITPGTPVALLNASRAGVHNLVITEGTSASNLMRGPGHRADTVLPGQAGVSVVFGRGVSYGAPFAELGRLRPGDRISAVTGEGRFTFHVLDVRRSGDRLPAPLTAGAGRLTLVSSEGDGWRSGWAPTQAVYVDTALDGPAKPASTGRPLTVPATQALLGHDSGVLPILVLWLEALVAVNAATVWAAHRWGARQSWLVGGPLVLAVVWALTDCAARMLPNVV